MQKGEVTWVSVTLFKLLYFVIGITVSENNFTTAEELSSYAHVCPSWKTNINIDSKVNSFSDKSIGKIALFSQNYTDQRSVGFSYFTQQTSNKYILAIYMGELELPDVQNITPPALLWSSNRDHLIQDDTTLTFTSDGNLILRDIDGNFVWSTNTTGLSMRSVGLNNNGKLLLLNGKGDTIWQSYDCPTDTPFLDFQLFGNKKQKLNSKVSTSNFSTGNYSLYVFVGTPNVFKGYIPVQFLAFIDLNPPQHFRSVDSIIYNYYNYSSYQPTFVYERFDQDGHHRTESILDDLFEDEVCGNCSYPTTCGRYGACMKSNECHSPPGSDDNLEYFRPNEASSLSSGCKLVTPLSCPNTNNIHHFLEFPNVTYFVSTPSLKKMDVESCKTAGSKQRSSKAAFFHYFDDPSSGDCNLHTELLTIMNVSEMIVAYKTGASIKLPEKLQNTTTTSTETSNKEKLILLYLSASFTGFTALVLVIGVCWYVLIKQKSSTKEIDDCRDVFIETVGRFSFSSLKFATQDFKIKLGRGGFGSVFEGTLDDGTKVAVKRLESSSQGGKEFLAEVNTIGKFHHFNLVRLIGFCDEGLKRLLVYEYMCNGSLDKWIFNQDVPLNWNIRRRIIEGLAAGLEYLHEHCKQNVIHFDIKPQNILLDQDFNVKIADFGLAKMVDRDQSEVVTMVRGTPGYMAPELINGCAISVKVDVYSFGVVILEIVCGRKNFGRSEGDILINLVKVKADEDQLFDLVDVRAGGMQENKEEVVNMIKIAIWCLQPHFIRPNMSKVVKILQDLSNIEALNDLSDLTTVHETNAEDASYKSKHHPTDSILSGPR